MSIEDQPFEKAGLLSDSERLETSQTLLQTLLHPNNDQQRRLRQYILLAVNTSVLLISILLNISTWVRSNSSGHAAPPEVPAVNSFATCIHETDMPDARGAVEYEQRIFTGALVYDVESKKVVRKNDGEREYFGAPSKEIDDAWKELLKGEFPVMTDEEAASYEPELKRIPMTGRFHFEPDVTHTLHCLNALRQEVSKTLYNVSSGHSHGDSAALPEGWDIAHMEHCMDRIRQSVMCQGDLSPSPLYFWEGFSIALGKTGVHTCRKWAPIRKWIDDRDTRGPLLSPE